MEFSSQETKSIWQRLDPPFLPSLSSHETVDVCVIGAGIAGLTTAYELLAAGRKVVVIERSDFANDQSALTSAHLSNVLGDRYFQLRRRHGKSGTHSIASSHSRAIDEIERIARVENIDCEFERVPGFLFLGPDHDEGYLRKELKACHAAGLLEVSLHSKNHSPLFEPGPCLRFPRQARFHPTKYLSGLARAILRHGGKIFVNTEATQVEGGHPARVSTNRGFQIVSEAIVVATNVPFNDRLTLHTKMAPYRTYIAAIPINAERNAVPLYWDTNAPYHFVRTCRDVDGSPLLLVGGEDHRTGQDPHEGNQFEKLMNWASKRLGVTGTARYQWSGQVIESHDGIAYIGPNPSDEENIFIVTGDSGNGLTHGTIAGLLLRDLIMGQENPWARLYSPSRVNLQSLATYLSENASSAAPYADWISPGDVSSIHEIPVGEGAVVRSGTQKIAAYREHNGRVHCYSAVCPHMNGIVRWNGVEKTWDCPCHGSRFDRMGRVINGPAPTGLAEIPVSPAREQDSASA